MILNIRHYQIGFPNFKEVNLNTQMKQKKSWESKANNEKQTISFEVDPSQKACVLSLKFKKTTLEPFDRKI